MIENSIIPFVIAALLGLAFGSFAGMASYRLPRGEAWIRPRSRCPSCGAALKARDLVPVLSWLLARGRCRHCGARVSARYILIESVTAALFVFVTFLAPDLSSAILLCGAAVGIVILCATDFEHRMIPDEIQLWLLALGGIYGVMESRGFAFMASGALLSGGVGALLHFGYARLRGKEVLGFGDVKLMAVAGVWLGTAPLPVFFFLSGLLGMALGLTWRLCGGGPRFPFGPALALALMTLLLFPQAQDAFARMIALAVSF